MTWEDVRRILPNQWLVIEALEAHTEGNKRIFDDIAIVDTFHDNNKALLGYVRLQKKYRRRELLFAHTSQPELKIIDEGEWIAVRPLRS